MTFNQLLKSKNMTQSKLSKLLAKDFKHFKYQQQISDWAMGIRYPTADSIFYIAKILNVSCDEVIESLMPTGDYDLLHSWS